MDKITTLSKYVLCEAAFGSTAKKGVTSTVNGYLETMRKGAMNLIRDRLKNVDRVGDHEEISDRIEKEMARLNGEYMSQLTEFLNTRKW